MISRECLLGVTCLKTIDLAARTASFTKKIPKDRSAFVLQNTGCDIASVIQSGHLQEVNHASCGPGNWICATKNHASDSSVNECACAHCARLLGHVEVAIGQPPITHS